MDEIMTSQAELNGWQPYKSHDPMDFFSEKVLQREFIDEHGRTFKESRRDIKNSFGVKGSETAKNSQNAISALFGTGVWEGADGASNVDEQCRLIYKHLEEAFTRIAAIEQGCQIQWQIGQESNRKIFGDSNVSVCSQIGRLHNSLVYLESQQRVHVKQLDSWTQRIGQEVADQVNRQSADMLTNNFGDEYQSHLQSEIKRFTENEISERLTNWESLYQLVTREAHLQEQELLNSNFSNLQAQI